MFCWPIFTIVLIYRPLGFPRSFRGFLGFFGFGGTTPLLEGNPKSKLAEEAFLFFEEAAAGVFLCSVSSSVLRARPCIPTICRLTSERPTKVLIHSGHLCLSAPWCRSRCNLKALIFLKNLLQAWQVKASRSKSDSSSMYFSVDTPDPEEEEGVGLGA